MPAPSADRTGCAERAHASSRASAPYLTLRIHARVMDHAGIHGLAGARAGLEIQVVAGDLDQRERLILIEVRRGHVGRMRIAAPQLSARSIDEVGDPFLRLEPLVD